VALFTVLFYSLTKRFTPLCHLVLGVGLALAPIGAYLAVTAHFDLISILIGCVVFFWVSGFDIIYALQDEEFDRSQNLKSIPVLLGKKNALQLSRIFHVVAAILLMTIYFLGQFHFLYSLGSAVFIGLLVYQQQLVKPHDLSKVNLAFGTTNGIASLIFCTLACADLIFLK
jgi:4-hydroxybenzoate polyprenyltransferase